MKKLMMFAAAVAAMSATADVTVTSVTAQQRWPWNNLVDVDFEIQGAASGEVFAIGVEAEWAGGAKKVVGTTFTTEPVAGNGANRVTWDFGADCPNTVAADCRISVTATPICRALCRHPPPLRRNIVGRGDARGRPSALRKGAARSRADGARA